MLTAKEAAITAVKALDSKKARDIVMLNVAELTVMAEYFVICTGTSNTHINTLCDECIKIMEEAGEKLSRVEGHRSGTWVLMDFGSSIVHVFTEETRQFYALERLWRDAAEVDIGEYKTAEYSNLT